MKYQCRCPRCRLRKTLAMAPEHYVREHHAKCPRCGVMLRIDRHRASGREARRRNCECGAYPWPGPHRRGSLFCVHGPAGKAGFEYPGQPQDEFIDWNMSR